VFKKLVDEPAPMNCPQFSRPGKSRDSIACSSAITIIATPLAYRVLGLPAASMVTRDAVLCDPGQGEAFEASCMDRAGIWIAYPAPSVSILGWQETRRDLKAAWSLQERRNAVFAQ